MRKRTRSTGTDASVSEGSASTSSRGAAACRHTAPRALVYNTYYINYISKSTRKLRVNYGVNDAGPGPCHGTTVPTVGTCWYRRYGTTYGTVP